MCSLCFLWDFPVFRVYGFIYLGVFFPNCFFSVLVFICVCLDISYPLTDDINVVTFYVLFVFCHVDTHFILFFLVHLLLTPFAHAFSPSLAQFFSPSRVFVFFHFNHIMWFIYVYFWINVFNIVCGFPFNFIKLLPQLLFSSKTFVWIQSMWKLLLYYLLTNIWSLLN